MTLGGIKERLLELRPKEGANQGKCWAYNLLEKGNSRDFQWSSG